MQKKHEQAIHQSIKKQSKILKHIIHFATFFNYFYHVFLINIRC